MLIDGWMKTQYRNQAISAEGNIDFISVLVAALKLGHWDLQVFKKYLRSNPFIPMHLNEKKVRVISLKNWNSSFAFNNAVQFSRVEQRQLACGSAGSVLVCVHLPWMQTSHSWGGLGSRVCVCVYLLVDVVGNIVKWGPTLVLAGRPMEFQLSHCPQLRSSPEDVRGLLTWPSKSSVAPTPHWTTCTVLAV